MWVNMAREIIKIKKSSRRTKLIGSNNNPKKVFNSRKEGKDFKTFFDRQSILPVISINNDKLVNIFGNKINFFDPTSLGLGQNIVSERINSFKDFPKIDPVKLIKTGGPYEAFPFVYNNRMNNDRYRVKDELSLDGVIEVLHVRRQNLITDIDTKGIKVSIGSGGFNETSNTTIPKKGSALIENKVLIEKNNNDFFEDCQDLLFANTTFPSVGNVNNLSRKMSNEGYISAGKPLLMPFKEKNIFSGSYSHVSKTIQNDLLEKTKRNVSDVGIRFKSKSNGHIMLSISNSNEKYALGTDSFSFVGLAKR